MLSDYLNQFALFYCAVQLSLCERTQCLPRKISQFWEAALSHFSYQQLDSSRSDPGPHTAAAALRATRSKQCRAAGLLKTQGERGILILCFSVLWHQSDLYAHKKNKGKEKQERVKNHHVTGKENQYAHPYPHPHPHPLPDPAILWRSEAQPVQETRQIAKRFRI